MRLLRLLISCHCVLTLKSSVIITQFSLKYSIQILEVQDNIYISFFNISYYNISMKVCINDLKASLFFQDILLSGYEIKKFKIKF